MCVSRWLVSKNLVRTEVEASVSCWQGVMYDRVARESMSRRRRKMGLHKDRRQVVDVSLLSRSVQLVFEETSRDDVAVALRYVVAYTLARSTVRPREKISSVVWR